MHCDHETCLVSLSCSSMCNLLCEHRTHVRLNLEYDGWSSHPKKLCSFELKQTHHKWTNAMSCQFICQHINQHNFTSDNTNMRCQGTTIWTQAGTTWKVHSPRSPNGSQLNHAKICYTFGNGWEVLVPRWIILNLGKWLTKWTTIDDSMQYNNGKSELFALSGYNCTALIQAYLPLPLVLKSDLHFSWVQSPSTPLRGRWKCSAKLRRATERYCKSSTLISEGTKRSLKEANAPPWKRREALGGGVI